MIALIPFANARLPLSELLSEGLANLRSQGQRSALALLGILIGTASIVAVLTIGHMAQQETLKLFQHLGVDMVQLHAMPADRFATGILDQTRIETLPRSDPAVLTSAALINDHDDVSAGAKTAQVGLVAANARLLDVENLEVREGRFIQPLDDGSLVAVVGLQAARSLSAPGAPIIPGARIAIKGYLYTVIGILGPEPNTVVDPTDTNTSIYIPLAGAGRVLDSAQPTTALVRLRPAVDAKRAGERLKSVLSNPTANIEVISARDAIKGMDHEKTIHSQLLTAVGAISLLVGGIGVMNVMLMGVIERRREIGLRAALGATPDDIGMMFLFEAATLACVGGLAGLVLGLLAAGVTAWLSHWTFGMDIWILPLGPLAAGAVGIAFGLYPAIKASRLNPIEALRAE